MKNQLKQWLFNKPVLFASVFFGMTIILGLVYSLFQTFLSFESILPIYFIFALSFICATYYMIKKLPHDEMYRNDFIAINNGASIISITTSLIAILLIGLAGPMIQRKMMMMYLLHQSAFLIIFIAIILLSLYILGVAVANIYAKYKRATTMGINPWRVILSIPFGFLLMWTPGYLIAEKGKKSNLVIKSNWYNRFNNWVLSNFSNVLFMFLFLTFARCVISGLPTLILTTALLVLYTLWYVKHKSDFVKNINNGYALTAVGINIAVLVAVLLTIG